MNDPRNTRNAPTTTLATASPALSPTDASAGTRVRAPALPIALAAQLFSAFSPKDMDKEDLAGALLQLATPPREGGLSGPQAGLEVCAFAEDLAGRGSAEEAESLVRQAVADEIDSAGAENERSVQLQVALADLLQQQGKSAEARRLFVKTVELQRARLGTQHPSTLRTLEKLAVLLVEQGDLRYAEPLLCEAVLVRRASQGDAHVDTLRALSNLSLLLLRQGKISDAEPLLRQCYSAQRRLLGSKHADTRTSMRYLAQLMQAQGNVADAEAFFARAVVLASESLGTNHVETLTATYQLAAFLMQQQRHAEARTLLRDLLVAVRRVCASRTQLLADVEAHLGACMRAVGDFARAERHLNDSFERSRESFGLAHASSQYSLGELIALYEAWGKPKEAAPYRLAYSACS